MIASPAVALVPATPGDIEFRLRLYIDNRRAEVAAWGWDEARQNAFLIMQFNAKLGSYRMQFPSAAHSIISVDGCQAGQLITEHTAGFIDLVDIALLSEFQGRGVGRMLIESLQAHAADAGDSIKLSVDKTNERAKMLYERLGFTVTGETDFSYWMIWTGSGKQQSQENTNG